MGVSISTSQASAYDIRLFAKSVVSCLVVIPAWRVARRLAEERIVLKKDKILNRMTTNTYWDNFTYELFYKVND